MSLLFGGAATDGKPSEKSAPLKQAAFAGGCFWCMETAFEGLPGVSEVISGYTGGTLTHPTYEQVSAGKTGHFEAVRVEYDPTKITYEKLLDVFWRSIDPTDAGGQFIDRGEQYRSAIFVQDDEERKQAEASKAKLAASKVFKDPIVTSILPAGIFYDAEDYHQDFYKKSPIRYKYYRYNSGRDQFLETTWGKTEH
ncbi:MAG: peptide-methionine (S)-S-oxide reductase MsrA [Acidobacteriota bacterium]